MASQEILSILKEAPVELILGQHPLWTWVFVAVIMDEFILGLDILCTHDASVYLKHCMLCD
jgi:hypothetical protein